LLSVVSYACDLRVIASFPTRRSSDLYKTLKGDTFMHIALIAHDKKKEEMIHFSIAYRSVLEKHQLFATGTTGAKISEATHLPVRSEEHTSELQSRFDLVCRLLLETKK